MITRIQKLLAHEHTIQALIDNQCELFFCVESLEDSKKEIARLEEKTSAWYYKLFAPRSYQSDMQNLHEWQVNKSNCETWREDFKAQIADAQKRLLDAGMDERILSFISDNDLIDYAYRQFEEAITAENISDLKSVIEKYPETKLAPVAEQAIQNYLEHSNQLAPVTAAPLTGPFFGQIDYLGRDRDGNTIIGETTLYNDYGLYKKEVAESLDCGRPISFRQITQAEYISNMANELTWEVGHEDAECEL